MSMLLTVGAIAERTGLKVHQVQHLAKTGRIVPVARAGRLHVFDESAIATVTRIQAERGQV